MQVSPQLAHAAYTQGQVSASNPLRIIVLLYEGAIRFTRQGLEQFANTAARGQALGRAHAIVSELQLALDHDTGGDVAGGLDRQGRGRPRGHAGHALLGGGHGCRVCFRHSACV